MLMHMNRVGFERLCEERKERIPNFIISRKRSLAFTLHIGLIYIHTHRTHNIVRQ